LPRTDSNVFVIMDVQMDMVGSRYLCMLHCNTFSVSVSLSWMNFKHNNCRRNYVISCKIMSFWNFCCSKEQEMFNTHSKTDMLPRNQTERKPKNYPL